MKKLLALAVIVAVGFFWDWIVAGVFGFMAESDAIVTGITLAIFIVPPVLFVWFIYRFVKCLRLRSNERVGRRVVDTNV